MQQRCNRTSTGRETNTSIIETLSKFIRTCSWIYVGFFVTGNKAFATHPRRASDITRITHRAGMFHTTSDMTPSMGRWTLPACPAVEHDTIDAATDTPSLPSRSNVTLSALRLTLLACPAGRAWHSRRDDWHAQPVGTLGIYHYTATLYLESCEVVQQYLTNKIAMHFHRSRRPRGQMRRTNGNHEKDILAVEYDEQMGIMKRTSSRTNRTNK